MPDSRDDVTAADQPTEVIPPVNVGETAVMEPVASDPAGDAASDDDPPAPFAPSAEDDGSQSWLGVAAFITGALALSVVAIVLGHLGLVAARRGRATTRGFALAGTILGYVGLVATVVLVWLAVRGPDPATVDAYAHHDVVEVGNTVADAVAGGDGVPPVAVVGDGYEVARSAVEGLLHTQRSVSIEAVGDLGWCLELDYVGGDVGSWSFESAEGVTEGGTCAAD
ncbi:DUF4190 domain-containing protein [Demequina sp. NBRC 110055]|uniref:DUF4190 domain-containing protein n=1 Tax=Demequina sp. NBRC 110055 TaxID=1570344 RepID=UPI000A075B87|nr:DUF4190 domain-containing protein [Demequina sp. NBRC 110055]